MKRIIIIVALLTICIFNSCDNDRITQSQTNIFSLEQFPLKIGNWWRYQIYDSLLSSYDTIEVTIVDSILSDSGQELTIWENRYSSGVDSDYVHISGDTIFFYTVLTYPIPYKSILFPLEVGNHWVSFPLPVNDTNLVMEVSSVITPAGIFYNCYNVERSTWAFNDYGYYLYYYVPDVGLVKQFKKQILWTEWLNQTWELIDYHIVQ